ncbi:protein of unknown function [Marinobacter daqiaonensis]|uniref:DUF4398 domain-containing protein n=1 Tax=Marinobacter daqiaonensis TaxID=650891 RepID=A0A1I6ICF3_9GAMM|nr:DUF4398 domain-containing protein [Marinobacter daqiaonensis]SFR64437.1 protein of unknown function [Marinobacter daqiaonensis]
MKSPVKPLMALAGLAALMAGCASDPGPKPSAELEEATLAVQEAETARAQNQEPALMEEARSKLTRARFLLEEQRHTEARQLLEQAALDARLAEARAGTQAVRDELGALMASIESLRNSLAAQEQ